MHMYKKEGGKKVVLDKLFKNSDGEFLSVKYRRSR